MPPWATSRHAQPGRVLLTGEERLDATVAHRLTSLLHLGDSHGEVALDYHVKERLRGFYRHTDIDAARTMLSELIEHASPPSTATASGHCSTPADPTGESWHPSSSNEHRTPARSEAHVQGSGLSLGPPVGVPWGMATPSDPGHITRTRRGGSIRVKATSSCRGWW